MDLPLSSGTKLGRYEIRSQLGAGGMGEVYLVQDTQLERTIALKVLPAAVTSDRRRMHRFVQEAKAAAALNHPNIAHIYEIGQADGISFIAMEYVDGPTLRQHLKQNPASLDEILNIAAQTASALAAAHDAGLVHRDIKPENIMLRRDGLLKVLDFGLVKLTEPETVNDAEAPTRALVQTDAGTVMGTANYMSPEQARGQNVDARTDIWSLGVVVYEMTTGRLPFIGDTSTDVIASIIKTQPIPLTRVAPQAPDKLEEIVTKALEKDREDRYQTVKDLLVDVRRLRKRIELQNELERSSAADKEIKAGVPTKNESSAVPTNVQQGETNVVASTGSISSAEYVASHIKRHKGAAVLISILLMFAVATLIYFSYFSRASQSAIDSLAVLPFTNATADSETEYLSDGITESLINSLSQITNLRVMSRSSVFRYKGRESDAQSVGKELGVGAVLIGRVAQRGDNLSISVELVNVKDMRHLWGEQYNRKLTDVLATQQEIAGGIADGLRLKLTGDERANLNKQYTHNPEAYQAYLRGRYLLNKYTEEAYKKSLEHFNRSVELDPSFALAFAGIADAYIVASDWYLSSKGSLPKARAAASRALEIDDSLAEAHNSMGWINTSYGDLAGGESEFKRAIELKPNYAFAHESYSIYLTVARRHAEALTEAKRARELDPLSPSANLRVGAALMEMGQYDQARVELQRAIEVDLNYWWPHSLLGEAYVRQARFDEAIAEFQKARQLDNNPYILGRLGQAYAQSGKRAEALKVLEELKGLSEKRYVSPENLACLYIGLGDRNQALDWLQRAFEDRSFALFFLYDPMWDGLRAEPRFQEIERQVTLPH